MKGSYLVVNHSDLIDGLTNITAKNVKLTDFKKEVTSDLKLCDFVMYIDENMEAAILKHRWSKLNIIDRTLQ